MSNQCPKCKATLVENDRGLLCRSCSYANYEVPLVKPRYAGYHARDKKERGEYNREQQKHKRAYTR